MITIRLRLPVTAREQEHAGRDIKESFNAIVQLFRIEATPPDMCRDGLRVSVCEQRMRHERLLCERLRDFLKRRRKTCVRFTGGHIPQRLCGRTKRADSARDFGHLRRFAVA